MSKIDSTLWRSGLKNRPPGRSGSPFRARCSSWMPAPGDAGLEVVADVVLVGQQDLAWSGGGQGGVIVQQVGQDLAFVGFGAG